MHDAARGDAPADLNHPAVAIQEEQIEGKPHPEGVDAATSRDQQPGAGAIPFEQRQPEEAAGEPGCDRNLEAEDPDPVEPTKADR